MRRRDFISAMVAASIAKPVGASIFAEPAPDLLSSGFPRELTMTRAGDDYHHFNDGRGRRAIYVNGKLDPWAFEANIAEGWAVSYHSDGAGGMVVLPTGKPLVTVRTGIISVRFLRDNSNGEDNQ